MSRKLNKLSDDEIYLNFDWAMKFIPVKSREPQSEFFGKRGISWNITVVMKNDESFDNENSVFDDGDDALDDSQQTSDQVISDLSIENEEDMNDIIRGNGPCDRYAAVIKSNARRYLNENHNVTNAPEFVAACQSYKGIKGVPAFDCRIEKSQFKTRIHRSWNIGSGLLIPWSQLNCDESKPNKEFSGKQRGYLRKKFDEGISGVRYWKPKEVILNMEILKEKGTFYFAASDSLSESQVRSYFCRLKRERQISSVPQSLDDQNFISDKTVIITDSKNDDEDEVTDSEIEALEEDFQDTENAVEEITVLEKFSTSAKIALQHNKNSKYALFDEIIDHSKIDSSNSINNIERRKLVSTEHDYHIQYWFCSPIWNKSIEELSLSIEQNVVWINIPPTNSHKNQSLNKIILKIHSPIIDVLKYYDCASLDLFEKLNDNPEMRHIDRVHFTPKGHRVITFYLIQIISNAPEKQNVISSTAQSSPSCHRLGHQDNRNLAYNSSKQKQIIIVLENGLLKTETLNIKLKCHLDHHMYLLVIYRFFSNDNNIYHKFLRLSAPKAAYND
ncbi:unnamed protein product [Rotaria socialis]|uniref:Uncharacterized protein n=2 Tax=Rotaria socialis TaxID=392032 RepID=A0A821JF71_9BILA|nr:unnamed protein product [Rotaria socialis]